jgi:hypothetical protein
MRVRAPYTLPSPPILKCGGMGWHPPPLACGPSNIAGWSIRGPLKRGPIPLTPLLNFSGGPSLPSVVPSHHRECAHVAPWGWSIRFASSQGSGFFFAPSPFTLRDLGTPNAPGTQQGGEADSRNDGRAGKGKRVTQYAKVLGAKRIMIPGCRPVS